MSTHYPGTPTETQALDSYIKLLRAVAVVGDRITKRETGGGLTPTQFGTLEMLHHLGPLQQNEIGQKLLTSKSNVVAIVDKLEKKDLVTRRRGIEDRRCVFVTITESGQALISSLLPAHVAAVTDAMSTLDIDEQRQLALLCRKLGLGDST